MANRHHNARPVSNVSPNTASKPAPSVGEVSARPSPKAITRDCDDPNPSPDLSPNELEID